LRGASFHHRGLGIAVENLVATLKRLDKHPLHIFLRRRAVTVVGPNAVLAFGIAYVALHRALAARDRKHVAIFVTGWNALLRVRLCAGA